MFGGFLEASPVKNHRGHTSMVRLGHNLQENVIKLVQARDTAGPSLVNLQQFCRYF